MSQQISAAFPFKLEYEKIHGSTMSYVEEGQPFNPTLLFLHGNPTSSYIWRNIIPHLSDAYRSIAPDLIGFGESDKPHDEYGFKEHPEALEEFIGKRA